MRVKVRVVHLTCKTLFRGLRLAPEHVRVCFEQLRHVTGMNPAPGTFQVVPVPKQHVYESGCEPGIRRDEVCDISAGKVWDAFGREFAFVNREVVFQDEGLIIDGIVRGG